MSVKLVKCYTCGGFMDEYSDCLFCAVQEKDREEVEPCENEWGDDGMEGWRDDEVAWSDSDSQTPDQED